MQMWITTVRVMNCITVDDTFPWDPSWHALVIRRRPADDEDDDDIDEGAPQVKIHIVCTLEHALDIIGIYMFAEDILLVCTTTDRYCRTYKMYDNGD